MVDFEAKLREERERQYTAGYFDRRGVHLAFWKGDEKYLNSIDYHWFFYAHPAQVKVNRRNVERLPGVTGLEPTADGRWIKVFADYFERRSLIEAFDDLGVEPLEADVNPFDRYMAEHDVNLDPNPRVLWFDLETDGSTGWEDIEGHRILSVAYREHGSDKTVFRCVDTADDAGERKLLDGFLDVVSRHDLLVAWNGDAYDEPVVRARCKRLGFSPVWRLVNFLDMLELFKKYYGRDASGEGVRVSFSLENIAQTVLNKGKIPDVPKHKMIEIWRTQRELMETYNVRDVDLMVELEEKLEYLKTHAILSHLCQRFLCTRSLRQAYVTDGFVLHHGAHNSQHFPTRRYGDDAPDKVKFEGAHVEDPIKGLHEGVVDLDFSSLYPNIVMAFNISPETYIQEEQAVAIKAPTCTAANGAVFRTDVEGIFPAVARIAVDSRQEFYRRAVELEKAGKEGTPEHLKALQTSAVWKILANAFFGGMGSHFARYYQPKCAEAITLTGQAGIKKIFDLARSRGIPVIYGDTDSAFLKCSVPVAEEFNDLAAAELDTYAESRGARPGGFRLKVDAEFLRIFFTRKKRYAGKKSTGKVDVRGLELVRSDKTKFERDMQKRMIEVILESRTPTARIAEAVARKWALKLFKREATADDLKYAETLSRPFEQYKAETIHVRIAKHLRDAGREVYVGMKIPYILVGKEGDRLKAVHVDDFDGEYDAALYWEKMFPSTKRVLEVCFPEQQATWDRLLKWRPDSPQGDLFEKPVELDDSRPVVFRFDPRDRDKFEELKAEMEKHPGEHPVRLDLRVNGIEVDLTTPVKVALRPELIKMLEKIVGHRVYHGPERWDREATNGQG